MRSTRVWVNRLLKGRCICIALTSLRDSSLLHDMVSIWDFSSQYWQWAPSFDISKKLVVSHIAVRDILSKKNLKNDDIVKNVPEGKLPWCQPWLPLPCVTATNPDAGSMDNHIKGRTLCVPRLLPRWGRAICILAVDVFEGAFS